MTDRADQSLPRARTDQLIVEELPDETLVYDLDRHQAHCLNRTVTLVWKRCDGKTTVTRIARSVERDLATSIDEDVVWLALDQLRRARLLEAEDGRLDRASISRRELARKYLPAALALPAILSITAPATAGVSVDPCSVPPFPIGCPCQGDDQCATFNCNAGVCGPKL